MGTYYTKRFPNLNFSNTNILYWYLCMLEYRYTSLDSRYNVLHGTSMIFRCKDFFRCNGKKWGGNANLSNALHIYVNFMCKIYLTLTIDGFNGRLVKLKKQ